MIQTNVAPTLTCFFCVSTFAPNSCCFHLSFLCLKVFLFQGLCINAFLLLLFLFFFSRDQMWQEIHMGKLVETTAFNKMRHPSFVASISLLLDSFNTCGALKVCVFEEYIMLLHEFVIAITPSLASSSDQRTSPTLSLISLKIYWNSPLMCSHECSLLVVYLFCNKPSSSSVRRHWHPNLSIVTNCCNYEYWMWVRAKQYIRSSVGLFWLP